MIKTQIISIEPIITIHQTPLADIRYGARTHRGLIVSFDDKEERRVVLSFNSVFGVKSVTNDFTYGPETKYKGTIENKAIRRTLQEVIPVRWYGHFTTNDDERIMEIIESKPFQIRHFVLEFGDDTLEVLAREFEILDSEEDI
ncbi:MAG TPA: hypothetical protein PLZ51_14650 [Aggregatilineales bacterium]|nr:hypothetical protein [Aggregatilineales bacterium]